MTTEERRSDGNQTVEMGNPLIGDLNLHLYLKFTDRGGRKVYEIYDAEDNKTRKKCLGTIRMTQEDGLQSALVDWWREESGK